MDGVPMATANSPTRGTFALGDKVTNRTIGLPVVGVIRGLLHRGDALTGTIADTSRWTKPYPEWAQWPVAFVCRVPTTKELAEIKRMLPGREMDPVIGEWYPIEDLAQFNPEELP